MTKLDLITISAEKADISKVKAGKALEAVLEGIKNNLKKGNKVSLIGFGTFTVNKRAARIGRNPKTGKEINIPPCRVPKFKPGKELRDAVRKK
ncbi:HU family DNA-binding protein [Candidatus Desantisbacteria bacterium]|nr:HU family DNA-binding protein [Candidatus Desantisbacteria bacterium]